jgi:hypothetical protein
MAAFRRIAGYSEAGRTTVLGSVSRLEVDGSASDTVCAGHNKAAFRRGEKTGDIGNFESKSPKKTI